VCHCRKLLYLQATEVLGWGMLDTLRHLIAFYSTAVTINRISNPNRGFPGSFVLAAKAKRQTCLCFRSLVLGLTLTAAVFFTSGCQTEQPRIPEPAGQTVAEHSDPIILREGDILKIDFPGAQELDSSQPIQRDGNITVKSIGEIKAAGKTLEQLRKDLLEKSGSSLVTKEVIITLQSSAFPVYVIGAVLRPGKVMSDHPLTVLMAVMEAGGFDFAKANLKNVTVLRQEVDHLNKFTMNMRKIMEGINDDQPFYLKPGDIVYVKEKFSWF
jgi:polysaccharide export outer membrane protein